MADLQPTSRNEKRKKTNPRIDLTPMVDLGFLLVTFFVFTSTLSSREVMELKIPADSGDSTLTPVSGAVTIIPGEKQIWYYEGETPANKTSIISLAYTEKETLRNRLIRVKRRLIQMNGNDNKMMVMIKPTLQTGFGQTISILDEMLICDIPHYALLDINNREEKLLAVR